MAKPSTALSKTSVAAERTSAILELDAEPETGSFVPTDGLRGEISFSSPNVNACAFQRFTERFDSRVEGIFGRSATEGTMVTLAEVDAMRRCRVLLALMATALVAAAQNPPDAPQK